MSEVLEKIDFQKETAPALATVSVVGLGYVGLPVAVAFGKRRRTVGYDLSTRSVADLQRRSTTHRRGLERGAAEAEHLDSPTMPPTSQYADFIIVAVPTPMNAARQPDLSPLEGAARPSAST